MVNVYDELVELVSNAGMLVGVSELLEWDQQVMMPQGASDLRAKQMGLLAHVHHEALTNPRIGEILSTIDVSTLSDEQKANLFEIKRDYDRAVNVPSSLAREFAQTTAVAYGVWKKARAANDFSMFAPHLSKIIELSKKQAAAIDPSKDAYQVLFEGYESDMSVDVVRDIFSKVRDAIVPMLKKINDERDISIFNAPVDVDVQKKLVEDLAKAIGYDFSKGRLDVTAHPFCAAYGRICTRYDTGWVHAITGTIHEAGHGMYEHNLKDEFVGTPLGEYRSLSVHESQSRFWENNIGKSSEFWDCFYDDMQEKYSPHLDNLSKDEFVSLLNQVRPGLIRVDADEMTYVLHIIIRFELEQEIIAGRLEVENIPAAWNAKYEEYLGIIPDSDANGCLQDVHWSSGIFGYFPTYALGSMMSAQIYYAMREDITDMDDLIARGEFSKIGDWLKERIHVHGRRYPTLKLIERACGNSFSSDYFVRYLREKFGKFYDLE